MSSLAGHEELLKQTASSLKLNSKGAVSVRRNRGLDREIGKIRGRVRQAKEENALEAALHARQTCLDELRAARDNDAKELVGNVLFNYLAGQQRDFQHPGVFTRASDCLLVSRTVVTMIQVRHRDGRCAGFSGFRHSTWARAELDELSSGTRLQLLLAVRVAFVEQQERGTAIAAGFRRDLGQ